jgi:amidase
LPAARALLVFPIPARFQQDPIVLSPVSCERPWIVNDDHTPVAQIAKAMRMVVAVNIRGLPGGALPVGRVDGLPQCVQWIGNRARQRR